MTTVVYNSTELGTVPGDVPTDGWDQRQVAMDVGTDGRPAVAVRGPEGIRMFGDPSAEQAERLSNAFPTEASAERPGGGRYRLITDHDGQPQLLQAGAAEPATRAVLQVCADRACGRVIQRVPVELEPAATSNWPPPRPDEIWLMAVSQDGRVALVRPYMSDHVYTVSF